MAAVSIESSQASFEIDNANNMSNARETSSLATFLSYKICFAALLSADDNNNCVGSGLITHETVHLIADRTNTCQIKWRTHILITHPQFAAGTLVNRSRSLSRRTFDRRRPHFYFSESTECANVFTCTSSSLAIDCYYFYLFFSKNYRVNRLM